MATRLAEARPAAPRDERPRRTAHAGLALAVIAGAQLMVILDATIVNIALPHIQGALGFSRTSLAWVLNAYTLAFGGLLLLGGRTGDIFGRRRMFIFGVLLFAVASLFGGFAVNETWLLVSRVAQGIGAAIASPTALSLVTTTFEEGTPRNRAFGVYAAVSGAGAAIGLIAGGLLTDLVSWRWVLFVNVPIGALIALAAPYVLPRGDRNRGALDLPGALTATAGVSSLTYGFIHAASQGWTDPLTLAAFAAAAVLLAAFVQVELRSPQPLVPLRLFGDRSRSGGYAVMLTAAAAIFAMFFFLTQYVQGVLGYSPLKAGFAFLPISATIIVVAQVASRLVERVPIHWLIATGAGFAAAGLLWMAQIGMHSSYLTLLLPAMLVIAIGMALIFVPVTLVAVAGVRNHDAGIASAMLNVTQQVGGTLGLSALVTVAATATRNDIANQVAAVRSKLAAGAMVAKPSHAQEIAIQTHALVHGWSTAFEVGAIFTVVGLIVGLIAIRVRPTQRASSSPVS